MNIKAAKEYRTMLKQVVGERSVVARGPFRQIDVVRFRFEYERKLLIRLQERSLHGTQSRKVNAFAPHVSQSADLLLLFLFLVHFLSVQCLPENLVRVQSGAGLANYVLQ